MKKVNVKKLILPNIPYVFIALLATKVSEAVRLAPGSDASTKLLNIMTGLNTAFHSLVPSFHPIDLCVGVAAAIAIRLAVYIKGKNAKKFRKNLEYGSARWGTACWRSPILTQKRSPKTTNFEFTDLSQCQKAVDESFFKESTGIRIA